LDAEAKGTTGYAAVRPKILFACEIPLPPLAEQQRAVARIEALAARTGQARALGQQSIEGADALESSYIDAALAALAANAPRASVASVAESVTDGDHLPPPRAEGGVPFLFISHVVRGVINFTNCKYVPVEYFESIAPSRVPRREDVLYTTVGSYGVPCLVDTDRPFCFQRHIALIRPKRQCVLPRYLVWALRSKDVFNQATTLATGSAQLTLPLRGLRMLSFPLPDLVVQRRVVAYLDALQEKTNALKTLQAETSAELDALMPSIHDKAFRGEL